MDGVTETIPRTELRTIRRALSDLRKDLITDAFALRPVPPLAATHPLVRKMPRRVRPYAPWLPHAALTAFAFYLMAVAGEIEGVGTALLSSVPVLVALYRPIGAWWLSFGGSVVWGLGVPEPIWDSMWPWPTTLFASHIAVMMIVASQNRPRVAGQMLLLTAAFGIACDFSADRGHTNAFPMVITSCLIVGAVVARRSLRETKQQVAVQQSATHEERSRRTLLEERATIARELHDVVAHHMSVIAIQAEAAPYRVANPPEELATSFATIRENAVAALTELRRVLGVVRADDPDAYADADPEAPQPTLATLDTLFAGVRAAGLTVEHITTGAVRPLPSGVELSAYRIVQETLSNALRHAPGSTARVEVAYVLGGLGLRIVNGPPTQAVRPSPGMGHGLLGMRERVAMLNGEMTAGAVEEDGGYEVAVFIPAAAVPEAEASGPEAPGPEASGQTSGQALGLKKGPAPEGETMKP
ncbi:two-component sensor histidine kinase [Streptomyces sp. 110]|uniref:histidine kinase n=1 Tax=Streptomyces endocoffeicus TaxID=2898945 RepID=A0ABS1PUR0_9ACTN|nr:histidine kinase [Streptomyces endocoffeicus]MBL1116163.1 two-component sensor histidine kinase [Streptomyces endocoffeicus]